MLLYAKSIIPLARWQNMVQNPEPEPVTGKATMLTKPHGGDFVAHPPEQLSMD